MLNPYYYIFYLYYSLLKKNKHYREDLLFYTYVFIFLSSMFHLGLIALTLKFRYHLKITFFPGLNSYVPVILILSIFFLLNYLLFSRKNRYEAIIEKMEKEKRYKKIITNTLFLIYFSIPFVLLIYSFF